MGRDKANPEFAAHLAKLFQYSYISDNHPTMCKIAQAQVKRLIGYSLLVWMVAAPTIHEKLDTIQVKAACFRCFLQFMVIASPRILIMVGDVTELP
eukprot:g42289.t1